MESENPQMPCRKQKNKRRSLPPGIYSIQFGKRAVVCPSNNGETLFVDGINPSQPSQMWLIGGNGSIMSLSASGRYTSTWPSAIATAPVTRSTDPYLWIINVKRGIKDGTFVGWIMSSDIGMVSWCLNGTNVQMQSEQMEWTFVDLTVAPGSDTNEPDRRQMLAHGAIKTLSHPLGLNDTVSFCVRVVNFGQDHVRTLNSAVNLMSGEGDYLLHIGFRPLENVIVFNTRKGPEEWAPEEKKNSHWSISVERREDYGH